MLQVTDTSRCLPKPCIIHLYLDGKKAGGTVMTADGPNTFNFEGEG